MRYPKDNLHTTLSVPSTSTFEMGIFLRHDNVHKITKTPSDFLLSYVKKELLSMPVLNFALLPLLSHSPLLVSEDEKLSF